MKNVQIGGGKLLLNRRAFTLIELLAVIVILAIIALIAVPIILNIIDDAKKESDERSIELYASAVKNGIAKYQLNEDAAPTEFSQIESYIKYDGARVECTTKEIYADGNIYLDGCTVNGGTETYDYGESGESDNPEEESGPKKYKPQYYNMTVGTVGGPLPYEYEYKGYVTENFRNGTYYVGLDASGGKVTAAYVCFKRNETEYCIKGTPEEYETNKEILKDAYKDVENACTEGSSWFSCGVDNLDVTTHLSGRVVAYYSYTDDIGITYESYCDASDSEFGCTG